MSAQMYLYMKVVNLSSSSVAVPTESANMDTHSMMIGNNTNDNHG